jgi:hypothetical protein
MCKEKKTNKPDRWKQVKTWKTTVERWSKVGVNNFFFFFDSSNIRWFTKGGRKKKITK